MNLYIRLFWIVVTSFLKPRLNFKDKVTLFLRVLPNDLDVNRHLNNGRYLTILDLCSIDLFIRSGILKIAFSKRYRPMIGGIIVTYRKGLSLFEQCKVSIELESWDNHWNFFRFEFRKSNGQLASTGYFKGAFISKEGIMPNEKLDSVLNFDRGLCKVSPAIEHWIASEKNMAVN